MALLSKPASTTHAAFVYVTGGALGLVWSSVFFCYLRNHAAPGDGRWFWCYGFLLSGATLLVIGLLMGRIGRHARNAELPPQETLPTVAQAELTAAARAPVMGAHYGAVIPGMSKARNDKETETAPHPTHHELSDVVAFLLGISLALIVSVVVLFLTESTWYTIAAMPATLLVFLGITKWF